MYTHILFFFVGMNAIIVKINVFDTEIPKIDMLFSYSLYIPYERSIVQWNGIEN